MIETPCAYLVVAVPPRRGAPRFVTDEHGELLGFDLEETAMFYAARLAGHGWAACSRPTTPSEVVDILLAAGDPLDEAPNRFNLLEAQTLDEQDLERWTLEQADRFAAQLSS